MPLPSQQSRSTGINPPSFGRGGGRRRARRRRFGAIVVIALAIIGVWYFWPSGDAKTPLNPTPASAAADTEKPATRDEPLQRPTRTPPRTSQASATPASSTSLADRLREQQREQADDGASALAARNEARLAEQAAAREAALKSAPEPDPVSPTQTLTQTPAESRTKDDPPAARPREASPTNATPAETPRETIETTAPATREPIVVVSSGSASQAIEDADSAIARNDPVDARDILNRALNNPRLDEADRGALRARLAEVAETLTFSPRVFPGDITADTYVIQSGDVLGAIPKREGFRVDHRLIQRINRIENPRRIRPGQKLKVLYGPFHIRIDKSDFRLDVFADQTDTGGNRLYIRSFPVGLGEFDSTPVGAWRIPPRSIGEKLINPGWTNPRTNETFKPDDPNNPIGEFWIPLEGVDQRTQGVSGYGIHGTIEPESIGKEMSMGCVRMGPEDIALVYEMVVQEMTTVEIVN